MATWNTPLPRAARAQLDADQSINFSAFNRVQLKVAEHMREETSSRIFTTSGSASLESFAYPGPLVADSESGSRLWIKFKFFPGENDLGWRSKNSGARILSTTILTTPSKTSVSRR